MRKIFIIILAIVSIAISKQVLAENNHIQNGTSAITTWGPEQDNGTDESYHETKDNTGFRDHRIEANHVRKYRNERRELRKDNRDSRHRRRGEFRERRHHKREKRFRKGIRKEHRREHKIERREHRREHRAERRMGHKVRQRATKHHRQNQHHNRRHHVERRHHRNHGRRR